MRALRRDALSIFTAALKAADPGEAIARHLRISGDLLIAGRKSYRLDGIRHVYVTGAGKAGATMAAAVEKLLGKRIKAGLVNTKYGHTARLRRIELNECGHPVPDNAGVHGAQRIAELARQATADDLVICLVSGGASALLPYPAGSITLADKQETTRLLLESGANIHEINTVRKHMSDIKGGRLAALAWPAPVLSLILSDVIGNDLDVIGSGITAPDGSTFADALAILERFGLTERVPRTVVAHLEAAENETPKAGHPAFRRVQNLIVGSNDLALQAAVTHAKSLGYRTLVLSSFIEGETRDVARVHAAIAKEIRHSGRPLKAPACIVSGGETTVTIRGTGKGGRNQEFALAAALDVSGLPATAILSAGTDGTDGPTDAAGALADSTTLTRAAELALDARASLADNNSYAFFDAVGDLIRTGPTGTNVMDVRLVLVG
ncbi:MAG TPA: glycerate kinase [Bryobacteraceae bacterium]|nr:glycerate kinase [Bryobacteraceae bacterium]